MKRESKQPEERKHEIVQAALRLFAERGYEKTAVSDIVKTVGVAQGLFYYYFSSKDQILHAVLDLLLEDLICESQKIVQRPDLPAPAKLLGMLAALSRTGERRGSVGEFIHRKENRILHAAFADRAAEIFAPMVTQVIREGCSSGYFSVSSPELTAAFFIGGIRVITHGAEETHASWSRERTSAFFSMLDQLFGSSPGTFEKAGDAAL